MAKTPSLKRVQINKANTTMVVATAIAAFVVAFTLVAGRALLNKQAFQSHVIKEKTKAVKQLQTNVDAAKTLTGSYEAFVSTPSNVLGGNPKGTGDKDGDNAKIVLDALPSQYDFPALASSLEKILGQSNFKVGSISGTDDEVNQQGNKASASPQPVEIPFTFSVTTDLKGTKDLLSILERSIRPINVSSLTISGDNNNLTVNVSASTFYQPGKNVTIETKDIK